jgi:hypothetical protein
VDGAGLQWNPKPPVPARMDTPGPPWTPLGDLRIRRLGVRVAPGALLVPLVEAVSERMRLPTLATASAMGAILESDHKVSDPRRDAIARGLSRGPRDNSGSQVVRIMPASGRGIEASAVTSRAPQQENVTTELELIDEYEFLVHPRFAGHGRTLFAGPTKSVDLKLVSRPEFGSGAVAMRYEPRR